MVDYAGNSKKDKEKSDRPEKKIEKVVTSDVVVQKKSLGRKFRDLFVEADFRSVFRYVFGEVLLPAARNTIVDASTKGIERMIYGDQAIRRRNYGGGMGPRVTYNNPINRGGYREPERVRYSPSGSAPRASTRAREDFILASREEADLVLERMSDIIDQFEAVSVADLNELVGFPTTPIDNKWGWSYLGDVQVRQIREGYLIDLPQPEELQ